MLASKAAGIRHALGDRLPSGWRDASEIRATLDAHAPGEIAAMTARAHLICRHVFNLLGSGPADLGPRIDWHCDFKSGYRWDSSRHYSGLRIDAQRGADVKVPWELSRGQHLPLLAQVELLTDNAGYGREAVEQIEDWIRANPPEFGVNWTCAMEVSIRAVNWLWTAALLSASPHVSDEFFVHLLASLLAHGRYVRANLEVMPDGTRTNHYIADLVGLLYLGLCVPEFEESREWQELARAELEREMQHQVLGDGVSYESSIPYHRLSAEMFVSAAILGRKHRIAFMPAFMARLERMIEFTAAYTKPNGLAPQIGDADDGRLHILSGYGSSDFRDHRHLLAAASVLFDRPEWRARAGDRWVEGLWLGGLGACQAGVITVPPPRCESAEFDQAGIYILRSDDGMVVFSAGAVGTDGLGNHKHNDLLAVEVQLGDEDILVDPGSYLYTSDSVARDAFRSTRAHSTVMVDGVEQNTIPSGSPFSLESDAAPTLVDWRVEPDETTVTCEHDGYTRLPSPVIHRRRVTLGRRDNRLRLDDEFVAGAGADAVHEIMWSFIFAPGCRISSTAGGWSIVTAGGRDVRLTVPRDRAGAPLAIVPVLEDGFVSPSYGVAVHAPVLRWQWAGSLPLSVQLELFTEHSANERHA